MNNHSAKLLKGKLRFGRYPNSEIIELLESRDFILIVDVSDLPLNYETYIKRVEYPIADRDAPKLNKKFSKLINKIVKTLETGPVYIHCRGGHGRSATVAACVLCETPEISGTEALKIVYNAHQKRKLAGPKFRKIGAPQTAIQKNFVKNYANIK